MLNFRFNCQAMLEDKLRATDWEATNEAIEEQVARESYLQWLKDNERRNNRVNVRFYLTFSSFHCQHKKLKLIVYFYANFCSVPQWPPVVLLLQHQLPAPTFDHRDPVLTEVTWAHPWVVPFVETMLLLKIPQPGFHPRHPFQAQAKHFPAPRSPLPHLRLRLPPKPWKLIWLKGPREVQNIPLNFWRQPLL